MQNKVKKLSQEFNKLLATITTIQDLEQLEDRFFSRRAGAVTALMKELQQLPLTEKKEFGHILNELKQRLQESLDATRIKLQRSSLTEIATSEVIDVTQPALNRGPVGHIHPLTQARWQLEDVALSMGFLVEDGPELESDYYVFEALNIPQHHPARDSQDTFYIKGHPNWTMRSHVSNMQVRLMRKYNQSGAKAVRAAYPGRCFRNEATDATHEHTFYQFEALMVDRDINLGHLVAVIKELLRGLYKRDVEVRLRPSYFPFVEPGLELDMKYTDRHGKTQWMEMLGCGPMHPNVLREAGYDPEEWSGFAFAFGLDRLVMLKYGIEDVRHFHGGDLRFLTQF